ncbi:MAG: branched-chain amino acid transport system permease protein livM [Solirubrobacteraceae bacterium]|jgi:branched-chain amino acid transport system permease protein|nr:branched-chain amino acid transport system permease protein livM [Solirubrobacteraceae bacterium]
MKELLLFAVLGLGQGALIAGVALGVVLTYRGSGIINLATGAVAMVGGFAFWALKTGEIGNGMGDVPALIITLIVTMAFGALMELVAFRPLRTASPLAKLVASLGVLLVAQATVLLLFGTGNKSAPTILPEGTTIIFDIPVPTNRFIIAGIVIAAAVVLWALYRFTKFGLATRAASENEINGMLAGLSPNRLSMTNTLLASLVAGGVGVMAASLTQLDANVLPLVIVPALAAALLARFTSFSIACAAGLGIGIVTSEIDYFGTLDWFPKADGAPIPGVKDLFVFAVIVLALFLRGASLPGRGELVEQRLPFVPRPEKLAQPAVVMSAICVVALIVLPFDFRQALINTMIGAVILLSLVVITGFVGQISVVQLALSGVAGFSVSQLATKADIFFPLGPILAIVIATLVGMIVAVSALRVRGVSLAVVTLAGAVAIQTFVFANPTWGAGGGVGSPVPDPTLFGFNLGSSNGFRGLDDKVPSPVLGFAILAVTVALCLLVANIRRVSLGRRMLAVRSNERAAAAAGVNVRAVKLTAFGISAFLAGTAGVLYAYNFGSVSPSRFAALTALGLISFAYLGGITTVSGAILGALITTEALMPHIFSKWIIPEGKTGTYTLLLGGVALIVTLIQNPEGIAGANYKKTQEKKRKKAQREALGEDAGRGGVAAVLRRSEP